MKDNDITARIYRQTNGAAWAYGEWRGWAASQLVLCAIDGHLAYSYLTRDHQGVRWYHVTLAVIERWAEEHGITVPPIEAAPSDEAGQ